VCLGTLLCEKFVLHISTLDSPVDSSVFEPAGLACANWFCTSLPNSIFSIMIFIFHEVYSLKSAIVGIFTAQNWQVQETKAFTS
jgi:hypothetical protein